MHIKEIYFTIKADEKVKYTSNCKKNVSRETFCGYIEGKVLY